MFRRLAVFAGGFTLAAAEQVAAGAGLPAGGVLDAADPAGRQVIAAGRPVRRGDALPPAGHRSRLRPRAPHRRRRVRPGPPGPRAVLRRLRGADRAQDRRRRPGRGGPGARAEPDRGGDPEHPRRRWSSPARPGDMAGALRITGPLERYAYLRGQYSEVRRWMDSAVTIGPAAPTMLLAKALLGSGRLAHLQCDYATAVRRLEAALRLYQELDDPHGIARALQGLGSVAREQGRYDRSLELHAEGLAIAEAAGDDRAVATARSYLGFASWLRGDYERAIAECTDRAAPGSGLWATWRASSGRCSAWARSPATRARLERAAALLEQSLVRSEGIGFREGVAWSLEQLGLLAAGRGDPEADGLLRRSLDLHRDAARPVADVQRARRPGRAGPGRRPGRRRRRCSAAAAGAARGDRHRVAPCEQAQHDATASGARAALGDDAFEAAWQHGLLAPLDDLLAARPRPSRAPPTGPRRAEHSQAARHPAARPSRARAEPRGRGVSRITRDPAHPGARRGHRAPRRHPRHRRGLRLRQAARAAVPAGLVAAADQRAARRRPVARPVATAARQRAAHRAARGAPGPRRPRLRRVRRRPVRRSTGPGRSTATSTPSSSPSRPRAGPSPPRPRCPTSSGPSPPTAVTS